MALKLRVGNFVEFPVTLKLNDGGKDKTFKLRLTAKRLSSQDWAAWFEAEENQNKSVTEVTKALLMDHITDWSEQTLVVDDDTGQPAEFSAEGLELMLGLFQVMGVVQTAYIEALGIKDGGTQKDARAKN